MKRGLWILMAALLTGIAAFLVTRQQSGCRTGGTMAAHDGHTKLPELEWLHREFKLTDKQFAKVAELHLAYRPTCESLCRKVQASHDKVAGLVGTARQVSPELKAALAEHAVLHVECQTAMLAHLYETAACMSPEQAKHYLDAVLPQVIEMGMEPEDGPGGHLTHP